MLTIPPELQSHYGKLQIKKSTSECELKKAKRKQHDITENWYREFRVFLGKNEYAELIELLSLENVLYDERFHPPAPNHNVFWKLESGILQKTIGRQNYINDLLELQKACCL